MPTKLSVEKFKEAIKTHYYSSLPLVKELVYSWQVIVESEISFINVIEAISVFDRLEFVREAVKDDKDQRISFDQFKEIMSLFRPDEIQELYIEWCDVRSDTRPSRLDELRDLRPILLRLLPSQKLKNYFTYLVSPYLQ